MFLQNFWSSICRTIIYDNNIAGIELKVGQETIKRMCIIVGWYNNTTIKALEPLLKNRLFYHWKLI